MPNIAKVLKEETIRLAKKEAGIALAVVKKDVAALKKTAADLKRRVAQLERGSRHLVAAETKRPSDAPALTPEEARRVRVTAKGIRSLRKKLGLTQADLATLVGVTTQSVYNWERAEGALGLRDATRAAVLSVKQLGIKSARQRLLDIAREAKAAKPETPQSKRRKRR